MSYEPPTIVAVNQMLGDAAQRFANCGANIYKQHYFGMWIGILKESGLETKPRCLGNYSRRRFRRVLSAHCKVGNVFLFMIAGNQVSTTHFKKAVGHIGDWNLDVAGRTRGGWRGHEVCYKHDLDLFFKNVPFLPLNVHLIGL